MSVVMGGYALAAQLHVSGSVAMAVAGLLTGNKGVADAMSDITRDYLESPHRDDEAKQGKVTPKPTYRLPEHGEYVT